MTKRSKNQQTVSQQYKPRNSLVILARTALVFLVVSVVIMNVFGYAYRLEWVGVIDSQTGQAKSLWDWMNLLLIPLLLAIGAFIFSESVKASDNQLAQQQRDNERTIADQRAALERGIATDNQRQVTLEAYFDRMTELLLANNLRESNEGDEVRSIARTRTLTVLRELDGRRKGQVLQFLYELNLISGKRPIVDMRFADLRELDLPYAKLENISLPEANLRKSNLYAAKLSGANFDLADLDDTILDWADLSNATLHSGLSKAQLSCTCLDGGVMFRANLHGAKLINSSLVGADLRYANFKYKNVHLGEGEDNLDRADLTLAKMNKSNLKGAKIDPAQLVSVSLEGAIMPNEMLYEEWREGLKKTPGSKLPDAFDDDCQEMTPPADSADSNQ
jgi:uncharacterized protein YjbI with pentapeptide repeats